MPSSAPNITSTNVRILLQNAAWALKLAWTIDKQLVSSIILVTLLLSAVPGVLAISIRGLVNAVAAVLAGQTGNGREIYLWLGLALAISLVDTVGNYANEFLGRRLEDEINIEITTDILTKASGLDLALLEDTSFQDTLERLREGVAVRLAAFISKILKIITNILQMVSLTLILTAIEPLVAVVLVCIALPFLFLQWRLAKSRYTLGLSRTTKQRWTRYYVTQLTNHNTLPEIKLLGISSLLIARYRSLMVDFRNQNRQIYGRIFAGTSLFAGVAAVAFFGTFALVVRQVILGNQTIGDVAVYGGAMARLRTSLERTIILITDALENTLYISQLQNFLQTEPQLKNKADLNIIPTAGKKCGGIRIRNLYFTYPQARKPALKGVSLRIEPGETVAIVGKNGAGKTTLVKLIARFYDPDQGFILFDGRDIRELSTVYLRSQIAFVFQHYGRYEATAAENIAYGNWVKAQQNPEFVQEIAMQTGIHDMIMGLPDGYETRLGRMFSDHTLSGGQWQRLAIARAFAREAPILILDEPTSNLDALAEFRLFNQFRRLAHGRTTILISHRFSTVSMADRIFFMDKGRIIATGSHHELLSQNGMYADLYKLHKRQMDFSKNKQTSSQPLKPEGET